MGILQEILTKRIRSLRAFGQPVLQGDLVLKAGANVSLGQSGNEITIAFSGARCWASVSAAGALLLCGMPWGTMTSGPLAPICQRTSTGVYTITWPSLVPDPLDGTPQSFAPKASQAGANTSARTASSRQTGLVTTVETYNVTGVVADAAFTLDVYA